MTRFQAHTEDTSPEASRPILKASLRQFGFVPAPVARAAESPALLKHMMASFAAFEHTSLEPVEREVVAMTVAFDVGCHYCMAMHSALLSALPGAHPQLLEALRAGHTLPTPRLQALAEFVRALIAHKGRAPEETWRAFTEAGFSTQQALDTVLGTSVYLLSTFANVLSEAPLDPAFAAFAWTAPSSALGAVGAG